MRRWQTMWTGVLTATERRSRVGHALSPCRVTRLIGMPRLLAVIAEQHSTARPLTRQLWTTGTARRYHHVPVVHNSHTSLVLIIHDTLPNTACTLMSRTQAIQLKPKPIHSHNSWCTTCTKQQTHWFNSRLHGLNHHLTLQTLLTMFEKLTYSSQCMQMTVTPHAALHTAIWLLLSGNNKWSKVIWLKAALLPHHHHHNGFTALFWDHPSEPVPEENFWTLWCKGRLTEADTPTIRLGATPSILTSAHLHHPQFCTGRMPFLPRNQQCQSTELTEGKVHSKLRVRNECV